MRTLLWAGVLAAVSGGLFAAWIVVHGLMDHGYIDRFHLGVALVCAGVGLFFLYRLFRSNRVRPDSGRTP